MMTHKPMIYQNRFFQIFNIKRLTFENLGFSKLNRSGNTAKKNRIIIYWPTTKIGYYLPLPLDSHSSAGER